MCLGVYVPGLWGGALQLCTAVQLDKPTLEKDVQRTYDTRVGLQAILLSFRASAQLSSGHRQPRVTSARNHSCTLRIFTA